MNAEFCFKCTRLSTSIHSLAQAHYYLSTYVLLMEKATIKIGFVIAALILIRQVYLMCNSHSLILAKVCFVRRVTAAVSDF